MTNFGGALDFPPTRLDRVLLACHSGAGATVRAGVALRQHGLPDGRLGMVRCNMGQANVTMCNGGNLGADHASNGYGRLIRNMPPNRRTRVIDGGL